MTKAERLQQRFRLIEESVAEVYGKPLAFAASTAAWLMAVQYATDRSMKRLNGFNLDAVSKAAAEEDRLLLDAEHEAMLRGFHREICAYLKVDPEQALEVSKAFEQVVRDICLQGG